MSTNISPVSGTDFEKEVVQADKLVIVDFWAEWCGPCKAIAPILDELATELDGKLKIAKVDIDKDSNDQIAAEYNVRAIPTMPPAGPERMASLP